jgi:lysozyme family protein
MAEFAIALLSLLSDGVEGRVYSNAPTDLGGETYCGVSRRHFPDLKLWLRVDIAKELCKGDHRRMSDWLNTDKDAQDSVNSFYLAWWTRNCLGLISSQKVANYIFQASVNCGEKTAAKWVQTVCRSNGNKVEIDGAIGALTVAAINSIQEKSFLDDMATMQRANYIGIIASNLEQIANKLGWYNRVKAFL